MARYDISIIGSGIVGSATGKGFHKLGHNVTFFDISKQKLATLREEGHQIASSLREAISRSDISFVCVNTPQNNDNNKGDSSSDIRHGIDPLDQDQGKHQDLSQLLSALRDIVNALNDNMIERKRLFVFRSTMLPGTMRNVVLDYMERNCDLKYGQDYEVLYNPEFLRQHSALEDFFSPDRVVIGEKLAGPSSILSDLYGPLTKNIIITGYEEAEMAKYAANCFLALKISYFNEIGLICRKMGIDEDQVSLSVAMDNRIGGYGTSGGRPFGGSCFPKDTEAFASFARNLYTKHDLIEMAIRINTNIENLNSAKVYVRDQATREHNMKESEI